MKNKPTKQFNTFNEKGLTPKHHRAILLIRTNACARSLVAPASMSKPISQQSNRCTILHELFSLLDEVLECADAKVFNCWERNLSLIISRLKRMPEKDDKSNPSQLIHIALVRALGTLAREEQSDFNYYCKERLESLINKVPDPIGRVQRDCNHEGKYISLAGSSLQGKEKDRHTHTSVSKSESPANTSAASSQGCSIPWVSAEVIREHDTAAEIHKLSSFIYDCSYLSPFISNLCHRERSVMGWYRWVGPDPFCEVRLPLKVTTSLTWLLCVEFHAFANIEHQERIELRVNGIRKQLSHSHGLTFQSQLTTFDLYSTTDPSDLALVSLLISVPEAQQTFKQGQRERTFAIRALSLIPSS